MKQSRVQIYERIVNGDQDLFVLVRPGIYRRESDGKEFNIIQLRHYYNFVGYENRIRRKRNFVTNLNGFKVEIA